MLDMSFFHKLDILLLGQLINISIPRFANADLVKHNTASLHPAELNEHFLPTLLT